MRYFLCLFALLHILFTQVYSSAPLEETFSSSPSEILTLAQSEDFLIHSLIHPLSRQPCLSQTDMVAQGAQPVEMRRIFIPGYIPLNEDNGVIAPSKHKHAGWVYCPHAHLNVFRKEEVKVKTKWITETLVSVADPNGVVLTYGIDRRNTFLKTRPHGVCNGVTEHPNGKYDPRNTKISVDGTKVLLQAPDGTKRYYFCSKYYQLTLNKDLYSCLYCLLEKEILPNGKVLRYEYNRDRQVSKITSLGPKEKIVYASIEIQASPFIGQVACKTHTGLTASYLHRSARHFKDQKKCIDLLYPLQLISASSPCFRDEVLTYKANVKESHLEEYVGRHICFKHHPEERHRLKTASELFLPGPSGFESICSIDYAPKTCKQGENTSVSHCDGTKTVYKFTKRSLPESVSYFNEKDQLVKEKVFTWTDNQWLQALTVKDGQENVLSEKTFEYDTFGNPISEKFIGNLSGSGQKEMHEIKREFSQDGFQLLLKEEDVKTVCYSYVPNTNLLASKLIKDGDACLLREFRFYDTSYNLFRIIQDDGSGDSEQDLTDVTYRLSKEFHLRHQHPFIHMPESMDEKYVENGEKRLLKRIVFVYDAHGNVVQEKIYDTKGQFAYAIDKTYDEQGNLLSETNALGKKIVRTFDSHGRETTSHNFSNTLHQIKEYDKRGNLSVIRQSGEGITKTYAYSYDLKDRLIRKTDSYQQATSYTYDLVANQPVRSEGPPLLGASGSLLPVIQKTTYDALGRDILSIDPNGNNTITQYNAYGSPTLIIHPDQSRETFRYTMNGLLETHVLPNGMTVHYEHDVLGHVTTKTFISKDEILARETFAYKGDLLIRQVDLEGYATDYAYDGAGRKIREERSGHVTNYRYDALGFLDFVYEENGDNSLCTHYKRDLLGQILEKKQTDVQGGVLSLIAYTYDDNGNVSTIERKINGKDAVDHFTYDPYDRETLHQDAEGFITQTSYNEKDCNNCGQQVLKKTTIDPQGRIIEETFDPYTRLSKRETFTPTHEAVAAEEHKYDPCGNILRHIDFVYEGTNPVSKKILAFTYDPCNRILSSTRAFGTPDSRTTQMTYFSGGNIASKTLPDGLRLDYTYDVWNHLTNIRSSDHRLSHVFHYNRLGSLLKATDELNGLTVTRQLDPHGNILQESINSITLSKTYDTFNRPLSLLLPDDTRIAYAYDPLYLKQIERLSSNPVYHHSYIYDTNGLPIEEHLISNLGSVIHERDLEGRPIRNISPYFSQICYYDSIGNLISQSIDASEEAFSYDPLSQLIEEPSHTYSYDSTYNRLQKDNTFCQTNGLDELSMDSIECRYDLRGNLIEKKLGDKTQTFTYTPLDQLSEVVIGNTKVCFSYDPLGRRIGRQQRTFFNQEWKEISNSTLFYDGEQELGQIENGKIQQLRVPGYQHRPIAIELYNKVYAPLLDTQGNIRRLIDTETNTIAAHYTYSAFGEQFTDEQLLPNPWQYAAKRLDFELGLIDFGKRHYDPQLGRWITLDPIGYVNNRNLYQYNFNHPFRYYDPNGTFAFAIPLFIPVISIGFDCLVTWITAEVLVNTAIGVSLVYGAYHVAHGIEGALSKDSPTMYQEAVVEEEKKEKKRYSPNQQTINDLVKESGKAGISNSDADALLDWSKEYDFPHRDDRGKDHWVGGEHIHIGGKHVPVH